MKPKRSLSQYVLDKKRKDCPVCKLPPAVIEQIRQASSRKIARPVVLEWLRNELKVKITSADFDLHNSQRHYAAEN